jgi:hypothetical protein
MSAANVDGHTVANTAAGKRFISVLNEDASPINVTVVTPGTVHGLAIADLVVAVPAGDNLMIGPFPPSTFNQGDGTVHVDFSAVSDITCAALSI